MVWYWLNRRTSGEYYLSGIMCGLSRIMLTVSRVSTMVCDVMKREVQITAQECTCERCGAVWLSIVADPKRCASCRTPYWNVPRTRGYSLSDLARMLGVSRQYVHQVMNPEKFAARQQVFTAIRTGKLERPTTCQACGGLGAVEAHHDDYSKPLEVEWLCVPCHKQTHVRKKLATAN